MTQRRTLVFVPGFNEPAEDFESLINGRNGLRGLSDFGFTCVPFTKPDTGLRERIDHFATFLDDLRTRNHEPPFVLLGYSLGGLVVRGFLRAYPHRAHEIGHTIMIATPNWGVETFATPYFARMLRIPDHAMEDLHVESDFMLWLNGTSGHWDHPRDIFQRDWMLDREPWIAPPHAKLLSIVGVVPSRGADNDGIIYADSATLGSRIPAHFIIGPHANHMNIIGHFAPFIFVMKGFLVNDQVWPHTLRAIVRFTQAQPLPVAKTE